LYKPGKDKEARETPLTSLTAEDINKINSIEIRRKNLADLSFKKTGQAWRLVKPFSARANKFNVNALLHITTTPVESSFTATAQELEKFGLSNPATVLTLDEYTIIVGRSHPLKNSRYVLSENTISVLPVQALRILENSENDFINNRLLNEGMKLSEILLPGVKISEKEGQWKVSTKKINGKNKKIPADKLNDFIAEWENARALTVLRYSGRQAVAKIKLKIKGKNAAGKAINNITLGILAYEPEFVLYRKDEDLEYRFPQEAGKRLLQPWLLAEERPGKK
ncbi:MAG: DUF4340 domain-containing protein, partial [Acidiferrobacterales bacterium]